MLNVLDVMLLGLTFCVVTIGCLVTNYERHLPFVLTKLYRYGCYGRAGRCSETVRRIELPKRYYRHFYVYAATVCAACLIYMLVVYFFDHHTSLCLIGAFEDLFGRKEPAVSGCAAVIALALFTFHCAKRCWESHYLQVFSSAGKINVLHYGVAFVHYSTVILAVVGQAPMFYDNQNRDTLWMDKRPKILYVSCILAFLLASHEQYQSNVILANLRKHKLNGTVITEEHGIPYGRMFQIVSSPHRLTEIVLYVVMATLIPTRTMSIMCFWVFCNQIQSAIHAHEWYMKTFRDYPEHRYAIFPYIL